jgi:uncharacterized protein YgiB involved in biofilm formation
MSSPFIRRSKQITLTIGAAAGLTLLAGCDKDPVPQDTVFSSVQECVAAFGSNALDTCTQTFQRARDSHMANAPRYASRQECREETGSDCVALDMPAQGAASSPWANQSAAATAAQVFIPAMAGVLIGRAMADGSRGMMPVYSGMSPQSRECTRERQQRGECQRSASGGSSAWFYSGNSGYVGTATRSNSGAFSGFSGTSDTASRLSAGAQNASRASASARTTASRSGGLGVSGMARGGVSS